MPAQHTGVDVRRVVCPVLVGRDEERRLLTEAILNPPRLIVVEGEAGAGKTRIVDEVVRNEQISSRHVLLGHCYDFALPFPLGAIWEALRTATSAIAGCDMSPLAGTLRPFLPELDAVLPPEPAGLGDSAADGQRLFAALREVLDSLGPTVLVIEDLQWADDRTLQFLRYTASRLPPMLAIITTRRTLEVSNPSLAPLLRFPDTLRVGIPPLSRDDITVLASNILQTQEISDEFVGYVYERTSGLPFLAEELLRLLRERKDLVFNRDHWERRDITELAVPKEVSEFVLERAALLKHDTRELLNVLAAFGSPQDETTLSTVTRLDEVATTRAITEGLASGFLKPQGDGYAFRHQLIQDALLETSAEPAVRGVHARIADCLKALPEPPPLELMHHLRQAGNRGWVDWAPSAAEAAMSVGDFESPTEFLGNALEIENNPRRRIVLAKWLSQAAYHGNRPERAISIVRSILDDPAISAPDAASLRLIFARLENLSGVLRSTVRRRMESVLRDSADPNEIAFALLHLALPWGEQDTFADHLAWITRATELTQAVEPSVRFKILGTRSAILLYGGLPDGWRSLGDLPQPSNIAEHREMQVTLHNLSHATMQLGYYGWSQLCLELMMDGPRREISNPVLEKAVPTAWILLDWLKGDWTNLSSRAESAISLGLPAHALLDALLVRGSLQAAAAEFDEAEVVLRAVVKMSLDLGCLPVASWAAGVLARVHLYKKDARAAVDVVKRPLEILRAKQMWTWTSGILPAAAEAYFRAGLTDEAEDIVREATNAMRAIDAPAAQAASVEAAACLAEAKGDLRAAAEDYSRAFRGWSGLPNQYEAARALEANGRCRLMLGDVGGKSDLLDALNRFERLGATWDTGRVRKTLRRLGISLTHRRGRKGYGDQLSPREEEVVRLVAAGYTNRQVAERLCLSPRTIDFYVANAMRKAGVHTRTGLSDFVAAAHIDITGRVAQKVR